MDSDTSTGSASSNGSGTQSDFRFAFNNSYFSDTVLMIEVVSDLAELKTGIGGVSVVVDCAQKRKRRRAEIKTRGNDADVNCNVQQMDDALADDKREEAIGMLEESSSGTVTTTNLPVSNANTNMDSSNPLRVRTLHISSPILAAKSPLFYELFTKGMKGSEQRHVTVQIYASEEAALMDLLSFMYGNTLSATTPTDVLDVLMVADKFEVASCMRYCSYLLRNLHMTTESALFYLDLPFNKLLANAVRPLTNAAKKFLARRFKDITKFQKDVLSLPLSGIEAVLSSDDLQIPSEDDVYDFALKWARMHYPKLEERREVWTSHLCHLIRFPFMTCMKLKKVMACNDFDPELASKLVFEALFYKAEEPYHQRSIAAKAGNALHVERAYKYKLVKALHFETPHQQCVIYLNLKRDECASLCPAGRVCSQAFHLGGQEFFLSAHCEMDQQNAFHCFGLFLGMLEKGSESFAVDYEFAARMNPGEEYVSKHKGNYTFTSGIVVGCRNLFGISWSTFLNGGSLYFINGILHLRAELTVRQ